MLLPDNSGLPDAPVDGLKYAWKDETWVEVKDYWNLNDLDDVNTTGLAANKILKWSGTEWITSDDAGGIPDAPLDSADYIWNNGAWALLANAVPITSIVTDVGTL